MLHGHEFLTEHTGKCKIEKYDPIFKEAEPHGSFPCLVLSNLKHAFSGILCLRVLLLTRRVGL